MQPKKDERLGLRLDAELKARLTAQAAAEDRTPSVLAVRYIRAGLDRDEARRRRRKKP